MAPRVGIRGIPVERLELSRAPTAEIAGAALDATEAAGLEKASFVLIATAPDDLEDTLAAVVAAVSPDAKP